MCLIVSGDTFPAMSCHGGEERGPRRGGTMGNTRRWQAGGDGQSPRPAKQVPPGPWGRERRLTGVRWPEGWECERRGRATCSPVARRNRTRRRARYPHHLSAAAGTATRHPEARLRRWSCAMWPLARLGCLRRAVGQGRGERPPPHRARQERLGGPITCTYEVCWEALAKFIGAQEMAKKLGEW